MPQSWDGSAERLRTNNFNLLPDNSYMPVAAL